MQIRIDSIPPVTASRPGRLLAIGSIRGGLSPNAENSSCEVRLDNGDGHYSGLFAAAAPPLGCNAVVMEGADTLFSGVVAGLVLSAECRLTLEA